MSCGNFFLKKKKRKENQVQVKIVVSFKISSLANIQTVTKVNVLMLYKTEQNTESWYFMFKWLFLLRHFMTFNCNFNKRSTHITHSDISNYDIKCTGYKRTGQTWPTWQILMVWSKPSSAVDSSQFLIQYYCKVL